jgi:hypothetical protein
MARITLEELRRLIRESQQGQLEKEWETADNVFGISLDNRIDDADTILDAELIGKTITYEARNATVVLDFDEKGYLVGIEFV